jgi:uncharacterized protein YndB with AHSA1/START domain
MEFEFTTFVISLIIQHTFNLKTNFMSAQNNHSITINSPVEKVWFALTNSDELPKYLPPMKVVSDWKEGSTVIYTHYEKDWSITVWNNAQMVWSGMIEKLETNSIFTVKYDGSTGVLKETYLLNSSENGTKLDFIQELTSQEVADNYIEGNEYTLKALKAYLENK